MAIDGLPGSSVGDRVAMKGTVASQLASPTETADIGFFDGLASSTTPPNLSPVSAVTSVSSSSASIASSSSDDSDMTHTQNAEDAEQISDTSRTNSLGLSGYEDHQQFSTSSFPQASRRKPFVYEDDEDDDRAVLRQKTPRAYDITPSICSVDEQGLLVPSSHGSSISASPASELSDPAEVETENVTTDCTIPAPRSVTEKELRDDVPDIAGMSSIGTVLLGAPV